MRGRSRCTVWFFGLFSAVSLAGCFGKGFDLNAKDGGTAGRASGDGSTPLASGGNGGAAGGGAGGQDASASGTVPGSAGTSGAIDVASGSGGLSGPDGSAGLPEGAPGSGGAIGSGGVLRSGGVVGSSGTVAFGGTGSTGGAATRGTTTGAGGFVGSRGGTVTAGGTMATGGTSATGGIVGSGGAVSCTNANTTVGTVGTCCVHDGVYGCSGNASAHKVLCSNGTWTANGDCSSGQYCDTRPGGTAGSCQNVVVECSGKNPGDVVCNNEVVEACGADLVTVAVVKTCSGSTPACLNGACVACSPGAKRCDVVGTNGVQTCGPNGSWGGPVACSGSTPLCSAGACVACPGKGGPSMVGLPLNYCIDSTEVTRGQYQVWLNTNPSTSGQVAGCSWNTDLTPGGGCDWPPTTATLSNPVECVDWCDAYAYCAAVGKRLCGKIGGGAIGFADYANASLNQWYAACTSNGTYSSTGYPYGNVYQATYCNGNGMGSGALPVGSLATCQSSVPDYSGIFDLSGNASEWVDSCDGTTGQTDHCRNPGGSWVTGSELMQCGSVKSEEYRADTTQGIGFRCCSP